MSKTKHPEDKKRLRYENDRRNCYGENDKSSRKNIKRSKQLSHQAFRSASAMLNTIGGRGADEDELMEVEAGILAKEKSKKLRAFKKVPDEPLKMHIDRKQARRIHASS